MNDTPAGFGRYFARIALMLAILVVLVAAGWTWLTLSWAYSVGERAGVLQKQLTEARRAHDAAVDAWAASAERLEKL